ncbi:hypothetical protein [Flavobacterium pectinovorum]|uniref:Uncharacterized protein n=1 Tax=Flavobacterium pectinovorum TaxID=29533 RepID=A0A502EF44_9FLAO|nr:hypothetical protein [Flavobacterium pectinovorum]TPG36288.1 hypothetical protein EAH81_19640 [Flavobacterium pectinovorum]
MKISTTLITLAIGLFSTINIKAQTLNPTFTITTPGSADTFVGGYTFSYAKAGTPWNGALISFGGAGNRYDCQISSDYGLNRISFRNKNGDYNIWNPWIELATKGANSFIGDQTIHGGLLVRNLGSTTASSAIMIAHSIAEGDYVTFGTSIRSITESGSSNVYGMQFFTQESYLTSQTEKLRIQGNGNVGIGTSNPKNKLDVNGTIHSKEVIVDMNNWSDFVFKKEYNLPTLKEVENHIEDKGHLENIPSEEEVLKNGINLGEMNAKLLQKIEELTLYMINQNKQIIDLQYRLEKMEVNTK